MWGVTNGRSTDINSFYQHAIPGAEFLLPGEFGGAPDSWRWRLVMTQTLLERGQCLAEVGILFFPFTNESASVKNRCMVAIECTSNFRERMVGE